jgi:hypothetical protein
MTLAVGNRVNSSSCKNKESPQEIRLIHQNKYKESTLIFRRDGW